MNETTSGFGWGSVVLIIILLFLGLGRGFGNGFGGGNGNGCGCGCNGWGGFPALPYGFGFADFGFQNYKAICDAEKATLINTATTQFKVVDTAAATQAAIKADGDATRAKIDFYAYQELRDKLAEAQRINSALETKLYTNAQFDVVNKELADIKCRMLPKPELTAFGASCTPVISPLSLYASALSHSGCGCGCSANALGI